METMMLTTTLLFNAAIPFLIWGLVAHLIADWLFQNTWMAQYKTNLKHPAAWVHAGIHTILYLFIFPLPVAITLGVIHMLIDTRKPLEWWGKYMSQTYEGEVAMHIRIWRDQVLHIVFLALAALVSAFILM